MLEPLSQTITQADAIAWDIERILSKYHNVIYTLEEREGRVMDVKITIIDKEDRK